MLYTLYYIKRNTCPQLEGPSQRAIALIYIMFICAIKKKKKQKRKRKQTCTKNFYLLFILIRINMFKKEKKVPGKG